jgi:hypothetical protein
MPRRVQLVRLGPDGTPAPAGPTVVAHTRLRPAGLDICSDVLLLHDGARAELYQLNLPAGGAPTLIAELDAPAVVQQRNNNDSNRHHADTDTKSSSAGSGDCNGADWGLTGAPSGSMVLGPGCLYRLSSNGSSVEVCSHTGAHKRWQQKGI